jgi:NADH:ubiquinone oxidoreductase subunit 5 (subunit L)/multisubunit Na+/H+ antiporter MnhA subunit
MLLNRIGDLGLALGICVVFVTFKSLDYAGVLSLVSLCEKNTFSFLFFEADTLSIISFLLF